MNKVVRIKNDNYTHISNFCAREKDLSLKAKGIYYIVMSLPDDWDFSIRGLCAITKEGKHSVYSAIDELKKHGYCSVNVERDNNHRIIGNNYTFYGEPSATQQHDSKPCPNNQDAENQDTGNRTQINEENNKDIEENSNKKEILKEKKKLDLSAVSAEMLPIVEDWLEYKKEKKQSYKQKGFSTFYNNLIKYSENNPVIARAIVDKSMGNNWDGAFPLKEEELKLIQTPTQELTLREKCDRFLEWLFKKRGEQAMMAYKISINDFSEMYRYYNDSAKLCEAVMELTKQPIMPNEKLIDLFRRQQKGE